MKADNFWAIWAKTKLYTSFESASMWYECLRSLMAWWQFYIAVHHSENDSFASYNSTCKLSNGNHCMSLASKQFSHINWMNCEIHHTKDFRDVKHLHKTLSRVFQFRILYSLCIWGLRVLMENIFSIFAKIMWNLFLWFDETAV